MESLKDLLKARLLVTSKVMSLVTSKAEGEESNVTFHEEGYYTKEASVQIGFTCFEGAVVGGLEGLAVGGSEGLLEGDELGDFEG